MQRFGAEDKSRRPEGLHAGPVDAHKSPKYGELETSVFCLFRGRCAGAMRFSATAPTGRRSRTSTPRCLEKAKNAVVLILGRGTIDFRFCEFVFISGGDGFVLGARRGEPRYAASVNLPSTR
jgi:hypothetical protein